MAIQSPGVEIREIDQSVRAVPRGGTSVLVPGFSQTGPTDDILAIGSLSEFERVYGKPTNAAERYFHQSAQAVLNSTGSLLTTRLPYGTGGGLGYTDNIHTALFYPVFPVHSESLAGGVASNQAATTTGEAGVTSLSASSAAFVNNHMAASFGGSTRSGSGVSLSGNSARSESVTDTRLDFNTDLRVHEGLSAGYIFGKPQLLRLSRDQYQDLREGNFQWRNHVLVDKTFAANDSTTWGHAGIIVTNMAKSVTNDKYEGFYLSVTDNSQFNPATDYDSVRKAYTVTANSSDLTLEIPKARRNFPLSGTATSNDDSVSEILESLPASDMAVDDYNDSLVFGLFKFQSSVFTQDTLTLDHSLAEGIIGSLDAQRRLLNPAGGNPETFYLGDVDDVSNRLDIRVNPYISMENGSWTNPNGTLPTKFARVLTERAVKDSQTRSLSGSFGSVPYSVLNSLTAQGFDLADSVVPIGDYVKQNTRVETIGNVPGKLDRIFQAHENVDLINVDLTVEAGLGTIYAGAQYNQGSLSNDLAKRDLFDDLAIMKVGDITPEGTTSGWYKSKEGAVTADTASDQAYSYIIDYRAVMKEFVDFSKEVRKDNMFIADPPRHIFVQGENGKVLDFDKTRTFNQWVLWPLKHTYSNQNHSYMAAYSNWGKCYDAATDAVHWCPLGAYVAGTMANTDAGWGPWYAPAGFTRGRIGGLLEMAVIQSQKNRDQLYKANINPISNFPGEGHVIFGQKTMNRKPSAFDRINVRRLFLALEKAVRRTMKYYVFEPNTVLTRTKVLNELTPVFNNIKNQQGIYDYMIVCDNRNNSNSTIDANEMVVDIYIQPVRTAEIILVNFYATRTGANFNEIIS